MYFLVFRNFSFVRLPLIVHWRAKPIVRRNVVNSVTRISIFFSLVNFKGSGQPCYVSWWNCISTLQFVNRDLDISLALFQEKKKTTITLNNRWSKSTISIFRRRIRNTSEANIFRSKTLENGREFYFSNIFASQIQFYRHGIRPTMVLPSN